MANAPELKPLLPKQREFIELIVYKGLSREEAYSQAYNVPMSSLKPEQLRSRASRAFYTPHINNYYHALMEEVRDTEAKKGAWTKEVATEKLMNLVEKAESELYDEGKQITMARLNSIVLPIKELNLMHGFNQTNLNMEGCIVQITGEDKIPD